MSPESPPRAGWRPPLAPLWGVLAAALWILGLVLLCLPLWGLSLALLKLSNLCLWAGYRLRDGLETLGHKVKAHTA